MAVFFKTELTHCINGAYCSQVAPKDKTCSWRDSVSRGESQAEEKTAFFACTIALESILRLVGYLRSIYDEARLVEMRGKIAPRALSGPK